MLKHLLGVRFQVDRVLKKTSTKSNDDSRELLHDRGSWVRVCNVEKHTEAQTESQPQYLEVCLVIAE